MSLIKTSDILEKQFVIVEDEKDQAESYKEMLDLPSETVSNVSIAFNLNEVLDSYLGKDSHYAFLIDLNLGVGREEEGLHVVKAVKKLFPEALVMVYTGNIRLKKKAVDAGADMVVKKDPTTYVQDFRAFREKIIDHFNELPITVLPSLIETITSDSIELFCAREDIANSKIRFFLRVYPKKLFSKIKDLFIGKPILVKTIQLGNKYEVEFFDGEGKFDISLFEPDIEWPEDSPINPQRK